MMMNGQTVSIDFNPFGNIDESKLLRDEPVELKTEYKVSLKQANISAEIPARFANCRFGDFECEFNDNMKALALDPKDNIVMMFSKAGCGKTSLCASAIHERALAGLDAGLYFSCLMLPALLRSCRNFNAKESEHQLLLRLSKVPFLVLDEVGASSNVIEEAEFISVLLRLRFDNMLPTWIATNFGTLNFKYFICNRQMPENIDMAQAEIEHLEVSNPTLNRIMSVAVPFVLQGTSKRKRG